MKAKLEFDLNDEYDRLAHRQAVRLAYRRDVSSERAYGALSDLQQLFREMTKYHIGIGKGSIMHTPNQESIVISEADSELLVSFVETLEDKFRAILEKERINLDDF